MATSLHGEKPCQSSKVASCGWVRPPPPPHAPTVKVATPEPYSLPCDASILSASACNPASLDAARAVAAGSASSSLWMSRA